MELAQIGRAVRADPASLEAYDLIPAGEVARVPIYEAVNRRVSSVRSKATEIDPGSAKAWSYVGYSHFMEHIAHWVPDPADALARAYEFQKKAVALDENDIEVSWKFGQVLLAMRRFDDAYLHFARALALNPNDTEARCQWAVYLDCMGHHEEALEHYDMAQRRNPIDTIGMPWMKGVCYFGARRYEDVCNRLQSRPGRSNHQTLCFRKFPILAVHSRLRQAARSASRTRCPLGPSPRLAVRRRAPLRRAPVYELWPDLACALALARSNWFGFAAHGSISATISSTDQSRSVTPPIREVRLLHFASFAALQHHGRCWG